MDIQFKPIWGKESSLPNVANKGNIYFTTDTGKIFLDITNQLEDRKLLYSFFNNYEINIENEALVINDGKHNNPNFLTSDEDRFLTNNNQVFRTQM